MLKKNTKICFAVSLVGCTLLLACLLVALSSPWHAEITDVEGTFQAMHFEVYTQAFYWGFYCEGAACNTFTVQGKETNGVYSWYDVCQDCNSQLTLYISTWVITFIATILLAILWILHVVIIWALSRGYPSKGFSVLLPIFWAIITILLFISVLVFAVSLPSTKSNDDSQCKRFVDAFVDKTANDSPCESFVGEMDWDRKSNSGVVLWGPATGFVFLILALVASPFLTVLGLITCKIIRKNANYFEQPDYSMVAMEDEMQLDNSFLTPGL